MDIVRNRKAQLEILALAFLAAGITTVASIGLLSTGGGAKARAEYAQAFLTGTNQFEEMETFYSDTMEFAVRNVLTSNGYDMNNFCAASVKVGTDLETQVIEEGEKLVSDYASYKSQRLPHMKTADGLIGKIDLSAYEEGYLRIGVGEFYLNKDEIVRELPKEYYATTISADVVLGGAGRTDIIVVAFDSAGKLSCSYTFKDLGTHQKTSATFSCEGLVKTIKARDTGWTNSVDSFDAEIKSPGLGFLQVEGKPAEVMQVKAGKPEISSGGEFSFIIPTNADSRPDLFAASLKFKNASGNEISGIGINKEIKIEAEFKNLGCVNLKKAPRVIINAGGNVVLDITDGQFSRGEAKIFSASWTPKVPGTALIISAIDLPNNTIVEGNENNNQMLKTISVINSTA